MATEKPAQTASGHPYKASNLKIHPSAAEQRQFCFIKLAGRYSVLNYFVNI
jgi:hypothetical protein